MPRLPKNVLKVYCEHWVGNSSLLRTMYMILDDQKISPALAASVTCRGRDST